MSLSTQKWTAIILAGQRPGIDKFASHFGEKYKALVPIDGIPMVSRVVRTVCALDNIGQVVVLAQEPEVIRDAVDAGGNAAIVTSLAGISDSIRGIVGTDIAPWPVLVTTADHPLLTADIIKGFLAQATDCDLAVGMVERQTMLARYPGNQRTWLRFADGAWSGANLFALNTDKTLGALTLWAEAEQDRKKAWKLFLHFGPWLALRAITRTISLRRGFIVAGKRLGMTAKLVALDNANAAIDVDKVSDYELAEKILASRS